LISTKNNWLINLSSTTVPHDVQCVMQLENNFSLPIDNKEKTIIELIKNIERSTNKFDIDTQLTLRNIFIPTINNLLNFFVPNNPINQKLNDSMKSCKSFIRNNPDIIFTRADKGNTTVILERKDYFKKINDMLLDTNIYTIIKRDPSNKMICNLRSLLTRWKNSNYISSAKYKSLYHSEGILPRAYGLPIHKDTAFRLIISSVDSPFYSLASFLQGIIIKHVPNTFSHIENSFKLMEKLKDIFISDNHILISLDVNCLFTVFHLTWLSIVLLRWGHIANSGSISREEFLNALKLIFDSTYFRIDGVIYKQNLGTPMGSPLSSIISDLIMHDLEERALETLGFSLPFYLRYVDDIAMAIPFNSVRKILNIFNGLHPRLQFTAEILHWRTTKLSRRDYH